MYNEYYEEELYADSYMDKKFYYGEPTESLHNDDYIYMKEQLEKGHFIKL